MANQQADGQIIVDTEIDNKGFIKDSDELRKAVKSLSNKIEGLGPTFQKALAGNASAIQKFNTTSATLEKTIENIEERMEEMADEKYPTAEYTHAIKEIEKTKQALEKLKSKQEQLKALGKDKTFSDEYKFTQKEIASVEKELGKLKSKQDALLDGSLKEYVDKIKEAAQERDATIAKNNKIINTPGIPEEYKISARQGNDSAKAMFEAQKQNLANKYSKDIAAEKALEAAISQANEKLAEHKAKLSELKTSGSMNTETAEWQKLQHQIDTAENELQNYKAKKEELENSGEGFVSGADTQTYQQLSENLSEAKSKLKEMNNQLPRSNKFASGLKSVFGKIASVVGSGINKGISAFTTKLKNARKSAGDLHKKILKMGLAMISIRGLMGGVRQLVSSVLNNNEDLQKQLTAVKGVLGQAFTPVINVLIKGLSTLVTLADRLYQVFTGTSLIAKYNAQQLAKQAKSTKEAAKEADKQLASFDELNVLTDSTKNSSDSNTDETSLFEAADLSSNMQDFINQFKNLWSVGDFEGIGSLISSKIVGVLQSIDWETIKKKAFNGGKSFAELLNGLFEYSDADGNTLMSSIGKTVGEIFNTLVSVIDGFASNLHWANLGSELSNGISTALTTIDWKKVFKTAISLGEGFGDFINGIFKYKDKDGNSLAKNLGTGLSNAIHTAFLAVISFVKTVDWQQIGTAIAEFIQNIDWVQLTDDLLTLLSDLCIALLDACIGLMEGIDWAKATDDLLAMFGKLFTSIDWAALAEKLSQLLGDLVGAALKILAQLTIDVAEFVQNIIDSIKDYFSQYFSWDDEPEDIINGLLQGCADAIKNIGNWIKEHIIDPFLEGVRNGFGIHSPSKKMAEIGGYLIDGLKDGIGDIWNKIKEKFTKLWTGVKEWFTTKKEDFKTKGSEIITNIKDGIGSVWGKIKEKFTTFLSDIKAWFTDKIDSFKALGTKVISNIKNGIGNIWGTVKSKFTDFITDIKNWFNEKVSEFKQLGKNIIDGLKNGISGNFDSVTSTVKSTVGGLVDKIKNFLGIHSPSRVFRDEIGKFIALGVGEGITQNIDKVVDDTATLARAISEEMSNNEFAISPIGVNGTESLRTGMDSFAGIITNGFTDLINSLQAIADKVTFCAPAIAKSGIIPYSVSATIASNDSNLGDKIEASNDELASVIIQSITNQTAALVSAIQNNKGQANGATDYNRLATNVIDEINRRTRALGMSPLTI